MLQKYLIFFVLSNITFQSSKGNEYVNEVNDLLTNLYWREGLQKFRSILGKYPVFEFFDPITRKTNNINGRVILSKLQSGKFVSKNNFNVKVFQYHFLLSCYYGIHLKFYLFYVKQLCIICKNMNPEICQIPLNNEVNMFITQLIKMKNSLLHFRRWLGDLDLKNDIYEVIDKVILISQHIQSTFPDDTIKNLHDEYHKIRTFFDNNMTKLITEEDMNTSLTMNYENIIDNLSMEIKLNAIFRSFYNAVNDILMMNSNLGFVYNDNLACVGVIAHTESSSTSFPQDDEEN